MTANTNTHVAHIVRFPSRADFDPELTKCDLARMLALFDEDDREVRRSPIYPATRTAPASVVHDAVGQA